MTTAMNSNVTPSASGAGLHSAARDALRRFLFTLGRDRPVREKIVLLACLQPADTGLDVGCGTGSLAIAAKRHIGPTGTVCGIDASAEMLARAERKTRKAGVEIVFKNAMAQGLP